MAGFGLVSVKSYFWSRTHVVVHLFLCMQEFRRLL